MTAHALPGNPQWIQVVRKIKGKRPNNDFFDLLGLVLIGGICHNALNIQKGQRGKYNQAGTISTLKAAG